MHQLHPADPAALRADLQSRLDDARRAAALVRTRLRLSADEPPRVAVVLGSGLGDFADSLAGSVALATADLPGYPLGTGVAGHAGRWVAGRLSRTDDRPILALQGRVHAYEGHPMAAVTFPIWVLRMLGVRTVVLTNAAGGIGRGMRPGDLMVIDDHLNFTGTSPLVGPNDEAFGPRFPDVSALYDPKLIELTEHAALDLGIPLRRGVYAGVLGPTYETPAEVRMFRALGADAVGMSTVPEALQAHHLGLRVLGISCITNLAAGLGDGKLDHAEVTEVGRRVRDRFAALLRAVLLDLNR